MSKRNLRKALVLATAGVIATSAFASIAGAQTVVNAQSTVTNSAKSVGPVPSGVSGVAVTVTCQNVIVTAPSTVGTQSYK